MRANSFRPTPKPTAPRELAWFLTTLDTPHAGSVLADTAMKFKSGTIARTVGQFLGPGIDDLTVAAVGALESQFGTVKGVDSFQSTSPSSLLGRTSPKPLGFNALGPEFLTCLLRMRSGRRQPPIAVKLPSPIARIQGVHVWPDFRCPLRREGDANDGVLYHSLLGLAS